jgi:hypothetical protein
MNCLQVGLSMHAVERKEPSSLGFRARLHGINSETQLASSSLWRGGHDSDGQRELCEKHSGVCSWLPVLSTAASSGGVVFMAELDNVPRRDSQSIISVVITSQVCSSSSE